MKIKKITDGHLHGSINVAFLRLHPERYLYKGDMVSLRFFYRRLFRYLRECNVCVMQPVLIDNECYLEFLLEDNRQADKFEKMFGVWKDEEVNE